MQKRIPSQIAVFIGVMLMYNLVAGQDIHQFKKGLAVGPVHRYGREAVVRDQLAYLLYSGNLQTPREGLSIPARDGDSTLVWQAVDADSTGRFRGPSLASGYLFLTYEAAAAQPASLTIQGNSMFFFNGEPHAGDIYRDGWMHIPVMLKEGVNEILIRCSPFTRWQGIQAELELLEKSVNLYTKDATLPHIIPGRSKSPLWGAVVVSNATGKTLSGAHLSATVEGRTVSTTLPPIPPMSIRKVGFRFDPENVKTKGTYECRLQLLQKKNTLSESTLPIDAVNISDHHSYTFRSDIDGSIQYYSVAPQSNGFEKGAALFLSVHGAGVEAIGQARAYKPKEWGTLVAPTNRRPRGFNWEDWGRLDAMEVLNIARKKFSPDPSRIYLTGHSMGGHGTWYLGATYPDLWAAIAPCAGYPTLTGYGSADGRIPKEGRNAMENLLLRASNPSNVIELAQNYKSFGIYIHHGDSDRVVSVDYARQMRNVLSEFHGDFSYYEYPGGSHWFGDESVDWPPLFEYFKWHTNKADTSVQVIDFSTANPAISSTYRWTTIVQQAKPLHYSRVQLTRNRADGMITGSTENVAMLKLDLSDFPKAVNRSISLDGEVITYNPEDTVLYLERKGDWQRGDAPDPAHKGTLRNGNFKEAFNHNFVFVYATKGNAAENQWSYNKARYDAEVWYYRGNGSVDIVSDRDFKPGAYPDRGVVIYGNASTNAAWNKLLSQCPVQLRRGIATVGTREFKGTDIGGYFMWPRPDSKTASVAVIGGTGLTGMQATEPNQYFAGGSGFPDFLIISVDMFRDGIDGVKAAGFYSNDWKIDTNEVEFQ